MSWHIKKAVGQQEMEEIPITTRFGNNELEYFNRIVRGYNPVITSKELKKKRTR